MGTIGTYNRPFTKTKKFHDTIEKRKHSFGKRRFYTLFRPLANGFGSCGIRHDVTLKLGLPTWAECSGIKQQNDVLMQAPWLNIIGVSSIMQ